jgi:hypothetical protein
VRETRVLRLGAARETPTVETPTDALRKTLQGTIEFVMCRIHEKTKEWKHIIGVHYVVLQQVS